MKRGYQYRLYVYYQLSCAYYFRTQMKQTNYLKFQIINCKTNEIEKLQVKNLQKKKRKFQ